MNALSRGADDMYHILTTRETQASLQAVFVSSEAESLNMIESSSYGRAVVCMVIMVGSKMPTLALKFEGDFDRQMPRQFFVRTSIAAHKVLYF